MIFQLSHQGETSVYTVNKLIVYATFTTWHGCSVFFRCSPISRTSPPTVAIPQDPSRDPSSPIALMYRYTRYSLHLLLVLTTLQGLLLVLLYHYQLMWAVTSACSGTHHHQISLPLLRICWTLSCSNYLLQKLSLYSIHLVSCLRCVHTTPWMPPDLTCACAHVHIQMFYM